MQTDVDALTAQVQENADAEQSAITLLGNLKTELDAAIASQPTDDGAALQSLTTKLGTSQAALAAAIVANTPAAPEPPAQS